MGKGEIACYECFQKACFPGASKGVIVWEWVNEGHLPKVTVKFLTHSSNFKMNKAFLKMVLLRRHGLCVGHTFKLKQYQHESSNADTGSTNCREVQCTRIITMPLLFPKLLPSFYE